MLDVLRPIIDALFAALSLFHGLTGNWGVAIILLTIATRVLLLPLTVKQINSMRASQELQPKLKELQERYKHDREQMGKEVMKFYQDHKVNPLGGCLPLLLQLPILLSLFYMLTDQKLNEGALAGQGFLWIADLTKGHDITLVVALAVTQLVSMLMVTKDPQQRRLVVPLTLIFPIIAWNFPSGVALYWVTLNIATAAQQWIQFQMPSPVAQLAQSPEKGSKQKAKSGSADNGIVDVSSKTTPPKEDESAGDASLANPPKQKKKPNGKKGARKKR